MRRFFAWLRREKPAPIKVGIVTSRSGLLETYGVTATQGFELGIDYATAGSRQIAGRLIQLLIEDDRGDPETGAAKARRLVEEERVHILEGCVSSAVAIEVSRIAQETERLFLIDPAATDVLTGEWFNPYVFRTAPNVSQDAVVGGRYAIEHLGRTFCFLAPDYVFGHQSRSAWWRVVEQQGGEIVGDILTPLDTTDYAPYLQEAVDAEAEVLVLFGAGSGVNILFNQMRQMDIPEAMKISFSLIERETLHVLGPSAIGIIGPARYHYTFPDNPVNDWLVRQHQERYGEPPDLFTGSGFAAGIALVEGLKRTQGDPSAEAMIPAMEGMRFQGPKGTYTLRLEDHQALQPMYMMELVKHPEASHAIPRLIKEIAPEESAPPLIKPQDPLSV